MTKSHAGYRDGDDAGDGEGHGDENGAPEGAPGPRCRWCRRTLPARTGPGRPKVFCSQRCRQSDWVSRQRARELELSDNELVVARNELNNLYDRLYALERAVADTERDLRADGQRTANELQEILRWLLDAAAGATARQ